MGLRVSSMVYGYHNFIYFKYANGISNPLQQIINIKASLTKFHVWRRHNIGQVSNLPTMTEWDTIAELHQLSRMEVQQVG